MADRDADPFEMGPSPTSPMELDDLTVERLLDGAVDPDDAPPGYAVVAQVLRAADAPVAEDELARGPAAIREIFEQARQSPRPAVAPGGGSSRSLRRVLQVGLAAVAASLALGGGVAFASTGSLPGPVQTVAHQLLAVVGIDVPEAGADDVPADPASDGSTSEPPPVVDGVADDPVTTSTTAVEVAAVPPGGPIDPAASTPAETRPQPPVSTGPPSTTPAETRPQPPVSSTPPSSVPRGRPDDDDEDEDDGAPATTGQGRVGTG